MKIYIYIYKQKQKTQSPKLIILKRRKYPFAGLGQIIIISNKIVTPAFATVEKFKTLIEKLWCLSAFIAQSLHTYVANKIVFIKRNFYYFDGDDDAA